MLTKKQKELLDYITVVNKKFGISPSYDEMKDKLKLKSKSGIHRIISALEERGFIRKLANKARAIEIIQNNKNVSPTNEAINKIIEIPYIQPIDVEGNSKSFPNIAKFLYLGFFYLVRIIQSLVTK